MRDFALRALKHLQLPLKSPLEAAPLLARGSIIGHGWEKNSVCSLPGLYKGPLRDLTVSMFDFTSFIKGG